MSIQYPAGTGFDPRMQRPRGQNVGQIGNIYIPQEEPQEQDNGIDAGDVIGTIAALAGAGALGLAGYRGVTGKNLWDRPNPAAATAAVQKTYTRPETQVRQAAARPSYQDTTVIDTGRVGNITRNLNKPTLTEVQTQTGSKYTPEYDLETLADEVIDDLAKERAAEQILKDLASEKVAESVASAPVVTEVVEAPKPKEFLKGFTAKRQGEGLPGTTWVEPNTVTTTKPLRTSAAPTPGKPINYGGKDQVVLDVDGDYVFIKDPDTADVSALKLLPVGESGSTPVTFEPEEISIEPYVMSTPRVNAARAQLRALGIARSEMSLANEIAATLGLPLHQARRAVRTQFGKPEFRDSVPDSLRIITNPTPKLLEKTNEIFGRYSEAKKQQEQARLFKLQEASWSSDAVRRELDATEKSKKVFDVANALDEQERERPGLEILGKQAIDQLGRYTYSPKVKKDVFIPTPEAALMAYASDAYDVPVELGRALTGLGEDGTPDPNTAPILGKRYEDLTPENKVTLWRIGQLMNAKAKEGLPQVVHENITSLGELVHGPRKGLSWNPQAGNEKLTRVAGVIPGTDLIKVGKRTNPAVSDYSILSPTLRNPLTGELGTPFDLGVSNGMAGAGTSGAGISKQVGRFIVGFEPRTPELVFSSSAASGKGTIRPEMEVIHALGDTDKDIVTRQDKISAMAPALNLGSLARLLERGTQVLPEEGFAGGYEAQLKRIPYYNKIELIEESPKGLLNAIANRKVRFANSDNKTPYVLPDRATHLSGDAVRTRGAIDTDPDGYGQFAPAGVDESGNKLKGFDPNITDYDIYYGNELQNLIATRDRSGLQPDQLQYVDDMIAAASKDPTAFARVSSLVRSKNDAAKNSNTVGARLNDLIEQGLTGGVEIGNVVSSLSGNYLPGRDFYASLGQNQESLPVTINEALKSDGALAEQALASVIESRPKGKKGDGAQVIGQLKGYLQNIERKKQERLLAQGLRTQPVEQNPEVNLSVLQGFRKGDGKERHEQMKTQVPARAVVTGLQKEFEDAPTTAGQGFGNDSQQQVIDAMKSKGKHKSGTQRVKDKLRSADSVANSRIKALDEINALLGNTAEYQARIDSEASGQQVARLANDDSLDYLIRMVQEDGDIPTQVIGFDEDGKAIRAISDDTYEALDRLRTAQGNEDVYAVEQDDDIYDEQVYARPSNLKNVRSSDPETQAIVEEYLTKVSGGELPFRPIKIQSKSGSAVLDYTSTGTERAVQPRLVPDSENPVRPDGKPNLKWLGGYVKPSAQNIRDYWVPEEVKSHWGAMAERYPNSIYGKADSLGISPVELQTRIIDNPENYTESEIREATKDVDPEYTYYSKRGGMMNSPVVAQAVSNKLKQLKFPASMEIKDYLDAVRYPGFEYSGNSPVELRGRIASETLGGLNDKRSMALKILRPGETEKGTNRGTGFIGGGIDDRVGGAATSLQQILNAYGWGKEASTADGVVHTVQSPAIDPDLPVGTALGQILYRTKDLESDPLRDYLFQKKEDGRFALTPAGRKLKMDDMTERRGLYPTGVSRPIISDRERKYQEREARRAEKQEAKRDNARSAMEKLSNEFADMATGENMSGSALGAINAALGLGPSAVPTLNKALKRAANRTGSRSANPTIVPGYEVLDAGGDGFTPQYLQIPAVESDGYESIGRVKPSSKATRQREAISQQQNKSLSELVNNYLTGIEGDLANDGSQVPVIQGKSILDQTGMRLTQFIDAFGAHPDAVAKHVNNRVKGRARADRSGYQRNLFDLRPYDSSASRETYYTPDGRVTTGTPAQIAQARNQNETNMISAQIARRAADPSMQLMLDGYAAMQGTRTPGVDVIQIPPFSKYQPQIAGLRQRINARNATRNQASEVSATQARIIADKNARADQFPAQSTSTDVDSEAYTSRLSTTDVNALAKDFERHMTPESARRHAEMVIRQHRINEVIKKNLTRNRRNQNGVMITDLNS